MYGKLVIGCNLIVRTGMHIGSAAQFSAIGAVDSTVIRDSMTQHPIVPGSSLKGKLRTLLARSLSADVQDMPNCDQDDERIKRLFGSAVPMKRAQLQFADCFVNNLEKMQGIGLTEVKAENSINRANAIANPRFIERVNAGTSFEVRIVYDVMDPQTVYEDLKLLAKGMKLLQMDYLGGHGSRGSGRVSFCRFALTPFEADVDCDALLKLFAEVEDYELLPVQTTV